MAEKMTAQEKQQLVCVINDEWMGTPGDDGTIAGDYGGWDFYMDEPFAFKNGDGSESVPYWEEKRKIVFCNLNATGDFEKDEYHTFTWDIFQRGVGYVREEPWQRQYFFVIACVKGSPANPCQALTLCLAFSKMNALKLMTQ